MNTNSFIRPFTFEELEKYASEYIMPIIWDNRDKEFMRVLEIENADCIVVDGFDYGESELEYSPERFYHPLKGALEYVD